MTKRFLVTTMMAVAGLVVCLGAAVMTTAQEMPAEYQEVLKTLGPERRLQGRSVEGKYTAGRFEDDNSGDCDADAIWIWRMGGVDSWHCRH
jgi:hypothetical protein